MRVLAALLIILFCTSPIGAEFNGSNFNSSSCSGQICVAEVKSRDKTVGLMWGAYVVPKEEFLIATELDGPGRYYSQSEPCKTAGSFAAHRET